MAYEITAGMVLEAIRDGAREGTAQAMKDMLETGNAKVTLTGSNVVIGGATYRLLPDGNTLVGTAAQRPSASAAASAVGIGVVYWAVDTNTYERSDGTAWGDLL